MRTIKRVRSRCDALHVGDCFEWLKTLPDGCVDACITDPPYGTRFMNEKWDMTGVTYKVDLWREVLRVLKPGAHLLAFGGTRTYHRLACAVEDAGFEIRDQVQWIYSNGFPKSLNVSKAIDKAAKVKRKITHYERHGTAVMGIMNDDNWKAKPDVPYTTSATPEAKQWDGWGTALKPAHESICLARVPLSEKTVAANVLKHGTGGININACRVDTHGERPRGSGNPCRSAPKQAIQPGRSGRSIGNITPPQGRYPANLVHDGSEIVIKAFPKTAKGTKRKALKRRFKKGDGWGMSASGSDYSGDSGTSAARYFYCAKASRAERNAGCEAFPEIIARRTQAGGDDTRGRPTPKNRNRHPTVKPLRLMRWLCRMIIPPDGTVLDPFAGSGTTLIAAMQEGFHYLGCELVPEYVQIAKARIGKVRGERTNEQ